MRTIDNEKEPLLDGQKEFLAMARIQNDATEEELKKKYMQDKDNERVQPTAEDIRLAEEKALAQNMFSILGIDPADVMGEEINMHEDDALERVTKKLNEVFKDELDGLKDDEEYQNKIKEMNRKAGIKEWEKRDYTNKDFLLTKEFETRQAKIDEQLQLSKNRKEAAARRARGEEVIDVDETYPGSESYESSRSFNGSTRSESTHRSSNGVFGSSNNQSNAAAFGNANMDYDESASKKKKEKNYNADLFGSSSKRMMDIAYSGEKKQAKKKSKTSYGGKEKLSLKSIWRKTKSWLSSKEAGVLATTCAALCLQVGMAMMTKRVDFDGPMQTVMFIGMSMGAFMVAREARAKGFDIRSISFM